MLIAEALYQEQLVGLEAGEVVQKIIGHQMEVVGTLGKVVVLINTKPEMEEACIAMSKTVQV